MPNQTWAEEGPEDADQPDGSDVVDPDPLAEDYPGQHITGPDVDDEGEQD